MEIIRESERPFRHGDWGPKYLVKGPFWEGGIVALLPGKRTELHLHDAVEEVFYVIEGSLTVIIDGREVPLGPGEAVRVDPGESHCLVNASDAAARAFFIKCPFLPEDTQRIAAE